VIVAPAAVVIEAGGVPAAPFATNVAVTVGGLAWDTVNCWVAVDPGSVAVTVMAAVLGVLFGLACAASVTVAFPEPETGLADSHEGSPPIAQFPVVVIVNDVVEAAAVGLHEVGDRDSDTADGAAAWVTSTVWTSCVTPPTVVMPTEPMRDTVSGFCCAVRVRVAFPVPAATLAVIQSGVETCQSVLEVIVTEVVVCSAAGDHVWGVADSVGGWPAWVMLIV